MNVPRKGKEAFDREDIYLSLFRRWKRGFYFKILPPGQQLELSLVGPFLYRLRSPFSPFKHAWAGVSRQSDTVLLEPSAPTSHCGRQKAVSMSS